MHLFTSESVTIGHPDKLCDRISDAILDAYLEQDRNARVALEAMATASGVYLAGEVTSTADVNRVAVARRVILATDYPGTRLRVQDMVTSQSAEIAAGVDRSLEARNGSVRKEDAQGAGDQGLMFGYATAETPDLMPAAITVAHTATDLLRKMRESGALPWLRPDGKAQATIEYRNGRPFGIDTMVISAQHAPGVGDEEIKKQLTEVAIAAARLNGFLDPIRILINPAGSFTHGGPQADAGLTGRKIIVDTYGGAAPHGGGAFSGKDPSKVDRSAAYALRWIAKHVVAAGLASRCLIQVAYAIGQARPVSIHLDTFGTETIDIKRIHRAVEKTFDLRPAAIIRDLYLDRPQYEATAENGHFGGTEFTWEQTPRLAQLIAAAHYGH